MVHGVGRGVRRFGRRHSRAGRRPPLALLHVFRARRRLRSRGGRRGGGWRGRGVGFQALGRRLGCHWRWWCVSSDRDSVQGSERRRREMLGRRWGPWVGASFGGVWRAVAWVRSKVRVPIRRVMMHFWSRSGSGLCGASGTSSLDKMLLRRD